jgi:hypothetical protein
MAPAIITSIQRHVIWIEHKYTYTDISEEVPIIYKSQLLVLRKDRYSKVPSSLPNNAHSRRFMWRQRSSLTSVSD